MKVVNNVQIKPVCIEIEYSSSILLIHFVWLLKKWWCNADEKRYIEAYQTLVRLIETPHIDNMKILKAFIYNKDDQLPLYDGSAKRRVRLLTTDTFSITFLAKYTDSS